jgi:hypothetical protein
MPIEGTPRYHVDADRMLTWLATAADPGGYLFAEMYEIDLTFRHDGEDLHDRIQALVGKAQDDGVLALKGHNLELWQAADEGFLLPAHP